MECLLNTIAYKGIELNPHYISNSYLSFKMTKIGLRRRFWGANLGTFDGNCLKNSAN